MPMHNLIEYSDNCLETLENLWQYYKDEAALKNNDVVIDFPPDNNNSISFKFKQQITTQTGNNGTKNVERIIP